jgi:predicted phosphodiesterase
MDAIISDIHANLTALEAVLADMANRSVERIICLGDVVGYGPCPVECLTTIRERCAFTLKGNHDIAVLLEPFGFNKPAREAALWTRRQLEPSWLSLPRTRANWACLRNAPERVTEGSNLFVHGSPRDPITEYVEESDTTDARFGPSEKIREIFDMIDLFCFVGHTHRPGVIDANFRFRKPVEFEQTWPLSLSTKAVVNVGSVGQPRDRDPRACYVTMDAEAIRFHRVEYDIQDTMKRIQAIPCLDNRLADRLLEGI